MPWSTGPVNDRIKMIGMWQRGERVSELAKRFGVTRQCVHKWIRRYEEEDRAGCAPEAGVEIESLEADAEQRDQGSDEHREARRPQEEWSAEVRVAFASYQRPRRRHVGGAVNLRIKPRMNSKEESADNYEAQRNEREPVLLRPGSRLRGPAARELSQSAHQGLPDPCR